MDYCGRWPWLVRACRVARRSHIWRYYLAEHLGCDPIIFVGQDLGFSDGLCYTPGTSYEDVWRPELSRYCSVEMKQWEQIVRERFILRKISDYQGRPDVHRGAAVYLSSAVRARLSENLDADHRCDRGRRLQARRDRDAAR